MLNQGKNELLYLEKHYGKKITTEKLNIEGFPKPIPFDIYDGYAVCFNHKGHRYDMRYPCMKAVQDSKEISDAIISYVGGIEDAEEITVIHVLMTFNTLYKDGVEVEV
jgi:hypothetical protein